MTAHQGGAHAGGRSDGHPFGGGGGGHHRHTGSGEGHNGRDAHPAAWLFSALHDTVAIRAPIIPLQRHNVLADEVVLVCVCAGEETLVRMLIVRRLCAHLSSTTQHVTVIVGGKTFATSIAVLRAVPGSLLEMATLQPRAEGNVVATIDRNPEARRHGCTGRVVYTSFSTRLHIIPHDPPQLFAMVLDFLRHTIVVKHDPTYWRLLPPEPPLLHRLMADAVFYEVYDLAAHVRWHHVAHTPISHTHNPPTPHMLVHDGVGTLPKPGVL